MVCAPVRRDNPRDLARDYLSVQAHKPCSISHLFSISILSFIYYVSDIFVVVVVK